MPTIPGPNRQPVVLTRPRAQSRRTGAIASTPVAVLFVVALLTAHGPARLAGAAAPAPAASYRLDTAVDLERGTVAVSESVRFRNVVGVALDSLVFRVVPNTLPDFELSMLTVDGQPADRRLDGSVLEVILPRPLPPGQSTRVDMRYSLAAPRQPGRMTATTRSMVLGYWFPMLTVYREDWDRRPFVDVGDAAFSEVADFDLTVTVNVPARVVATGEVVEQDGQRWQFQARGVRDVALAVSPDFVLRRAEADTTVVDAWTYTPERASYYVSRAPSFLRWGQEKLGPYPYQSLDIADADLPASFGGLEYPGLIVLSRAYPAASPPEGSGLDSLLLHEILHQWFYALVGNDQIADPWLDEAMVTYLTYAYYREVRPDLAPAVYERTIAGGPAGAVDTTVYDYPSDAAYFVVVYRRGARFLEALHARIGDGLFWSLLREHVTMYRDRIAAPRSFLDRALAASPATVGPLIAEHFSYGAFRTATARVWSVEAPSGTWTGTANVFVAAEFPVTRVQVFLDQRKMADGASNDLMLDLSDVEPGSYVLLVRVWDHDDVLFERGRRVEISR